MPQSITHEVHFVRVYPHTARLPCAGFMQCTSEEQASRLARDLLVYDHARAGGSHVYTRIKIRSVENA